MKKIEENKKFATDWFKSLRNKICSELEKIEKEESNKSIKFLRKKWSRSKTGVNSLGGGEMSILRGKIFEKAGVNISTVFGDISSKLKGKIPGTKKNNYFWASGISVVIHPYSPKIPAIHMNTRYIITEKSWFGGGIDITPTNKVSIESKNHAKLLHSELKKICDNYSAGSYKKFKKQCDEYFFLPHRNESRGLGGIFYDYLNSGNWNDDFIFQQNIGSAFIDVYKKIVLESKNKPWNENDKKMQYMRRARYTEFNLLYDRGTKFGLETDGNIEAIFMSLPPFASW